MGAPSGSGGAFSDAAPPPHEQQEPQGIALADCAAWAAATLDADPASPAARLWAAIRRAAYGTGRGRLAYALRGLTCRLLPLPAPWGEA